MTPLLSAGHLCTYKGITQGGPSLGSGKAAAIGTCGGHPTTPVYEAGIAQKPGLGGRHESLVQQWRHSGFGNKAEWCAQGSSAPEAEQSLGYPPLLTRNSGNKPSGRVQQGPRVSFLLSPVLLPGINLGHHFWRQLCAPTYSHTELHIC